MYKKPIMRWHFNTDLSKISWAIWIWKGISGKGQLLQRLCGSMYLKCVRNSKENYWLEQQQGEVGGNDRPEGHWKYLGISPIVGRHHMIWGRKVTRSGFCFQTDHSGCWSRRKLRIPVHQSMQEITEHHFPVLSAISQRLLMWFSLCWEEAGALVYQQSTVVFSSASHWPRQVQHSKKTEATRAESSLVYCRRLPQHPC
jgi:hypothetical protein